MTKPLTFSQASNLIKDPEYVAIENEIIALDKAFEEAFAKLVEKFPLEPNYKWGLSGAGRLRPWFVSIYAE